MTNDLARAISLETRDQREAVSNAEATLLDHSGSFRRAATRGAGASGFSSAGSRNAKEMFKWAIQQSAAGGQGVPGASDEIKTAQVQ